MKRIVLITTLFSAFITYSAVWENDPSLTPEQQEERRQNNQDMRRRKEEREAEMNKLIEHATQKYNDEINEIKQKYGQPIEG